MIGIEELEAKVKMAAELLILRLVSGRPMYGYELVQAIRLATNLANPVSMTTRVVHQIVIAAEARPMSQWPPMKSQIAKITPQATSAR